MIGLSLKFREARLIRTMSNKALFSVEEVQSRRKEKKKKIWILMLTLAS